MVSRRIAMPDRLAGWGATCVAWSGLMLVGAVGFGQDAKETVEAKVEKPAAAVTFSQPDPSIAIDEAERKSLEAAVEEFAKTFNAHNPKELAAWYTENAELTNQAGRVTRGQAAILASFEKLFAEQPQITMQLEVQSLRLLGPAVGVLEGISSMTIGEDANQEAHRDRYTITLAKQDGKWLIAAARDWAPPPPTSEEQLKQLEWLVGDWVDENSDTLVRTTYHWSDDKRYLFSKYTVQRQGQPAVEGLQRIGWDPQLRQLHSWTFDNAGGFTEGLYSRAGDRWVIKLTGVLGDGRIRSATNILTRLGPDHATFQSRDRVTGGEVQPDYEPVPIVRKPPQPSVPKAEVKAAENVDSKGTESK